VSNVRQTAYTVDDSGNLIDAKYETPRLTVSYERKVNLGNYESASVFVSMQVDAGDDNDETLQAIKDAFVMVRASAYEQMGIKFSVDEAGIVQERLERTFGPVEVVSGDEAKPFNKPQPPSKPRSDTVAPKSKKALWEELANNPSQWFDNREGKRNPKSPDFKRKNTGEGLWLTYNGQSAVPAGIDIPDSGFANG
jgi:hypothetical protein